MLIPLKTSFTLKLKHLIFGYKKSDNNYYGANYRKYLEKDYIFREYIHGNDRVTSSALDRYTG